jgi:hypothetical protein
MNLAYFRGRLVRLWVLLAIAVAYIGWMLIRQTLTHNSRLDGSIGVLGGLYVCSNPAASFFDLLYFRRRLIGNLLHPSAQIAWIALNLVVFSFGCLMITVGVIYFIT